MAESPIALLVPIVYLLIAIAVVIGLVVFVRVIAKWKRQYVQGERSAANYFPLAVILIILICIVAGGYAGFAGMMIYAVFFAPPGPYADGAGILMLLLGTAAGVVAALNCLGIFSWWLAIRPWRARRKTAQ